MIRKRRDKRGRRPGDFDRWLPAKFLVRCFLFWGAALWLVTRIPIIEQLGIRLTVATLRAALAPLGQSVEWFASVLYVGNESVQIVSDCSPHMPFLVFAGAVLAFPSSWRQRLLGLALGAVVIHLFNSVRILVLMGILVWQKSWFEFAHVYLWQTGTILIVFAAFALWIRSLSLRPGFDRQ